MRKVQRRAWGEREVVRTKRSGGSNSTAREGASKADATNVGTVPTVAVLGACGKEDGVGSLARIWQHELLADSACHVAEGAC